MKKYLLLNILISFFCLSFENLSAQCPTVAGTTINVCNNSEGGTITIIFTDGSTTEQQNYILFDTNGPVAVSEPFGSVTKSYNATTQTLVFGNVPDGTYLASRAGCPPLGGFGIGVNQLNELKFSSIVITEDCDNLGSGTIDIDVVGGTSPYTYLWSNGEVTQDVINLVAGTYSVSITDANFCTLDSTGIVVNVGPNAGTALPGNGDACTTDISYDLFGLLDGSEDAGGTWSILTGSGASVNGSTGVVDFTGATGGIFTFQYTVTAGSCTPDQEDVVVNVIEAATSEAGDDVSICAGDALDLSVSGTVSASNFSSLLWTTPGDGSFSDATVLTPVYTPGASDISNGTVVLTLTANGNASCDPAVDNMTLTITTGPTADAGSDEEICSDIAFDMSTAATQPTATNFSSVLWTTSGDGTFGDATSVVTTYTPGATDITNGTATLTLTANGNGSCAPISNDMILTITPAATSEAGDDVSICAGDALDLSVSGTVSASNFSSLLWTTPGDGSFSDATVLTPVYTPGASDISNGTVVLTLTANGNASCDPAVDNMTLTITTGPTADAGSDEAICEGTGYDLGTSLTPPSASNFSALSWTTSGDGSFSDATVLSPIYTPGANDAANGSVILTLEAIGLGSCSPVTDDVELTIITGPTADAGSDEEICSDIAFDMSTAATQPTATNFSSVLWTTSGDGTFGDATSVVTTYTPGATDITNGTATLTLTANGNGSCAPISNDMILTITPAATSEAGDDVSICAGDALDLSVSGTVSASNFSSLLWTTPGDGSFSDATVLTPVYTPGASDISNGTVVLTLTANGNASCDPAVDNMTLTITTGPTADAGSDEEICSDIAFDMSTAATQPTATNFSSVLWTTSGDGTFGDATSVVTTYTPGATDITNGTATLTLTANGNGSCAPISNDMILTITPAATSEAGDDVSICAGDALDLSVSGTVSASNFSSLLWTTPGDGSFSDATVLTPVYTPGASDISNGTVVLTLTANGNASCDPAVDNMTLTITTGPTADAGSDEEICSDIAFDMSTAATQPTATNFSSVLWTTSGDGTFGDATSVVTTYTPGATDITNGTATLTLTANGNGSCAPISNDMILTITPAATSEAGDDVSICAGDALDLSVSGTVSASNFSSLLWTTPGDGSFSDATVLTPVYTPGASDISNGTVVLTLTANGNASCDPAVDNMTLTITTGPTADAGSDEEICSDIAFDMSTAATQPTATNFSSVLWTTSGDGTFGDATSVVTTYTPGATDITNGIATLTLTANGNGSCAPISNDMILTITPAATSEAGDDVSICAGDALDLSVSGTVSASNFSSLLWTTPGDGSFSDATVLTPVYTPGASDISNGTVVLTLTANGNASCDPAVDNMTLTITTGPTADAGSDEAICEGTGYDLGTSLTPPSASNFSALSWTTSGDGSFSDATVLSPIYTPGANDAANGSVILTLEAIGLGSCSPVTDDVELTIITGPTADAGSDEEICSDIAFDMSTAATQPTATNFSSVLWTTSGDGTFGDATSVVTTYTPGATDITNGTATLTLTANGNGSCAPISNDMILTITPAATSEAGDDVSICAGDALDLSVSGTVSASNFSSLLWTTPGDGSFSDATVLTPVYTPGASDISNGTVVLTLTANGNASCDPAVDNMTLTITTGPTADAGSDEEICSDIAFDMSTAATQPTATNFSSVLWTTSGDGTFGDATSVVTTYTPGATDITNGTATLTLTANGNGSCAPISNDMILTITPAATSEAGDDVSICAGDALDLSVSGTVSASNFNSLLWTTPGDGSFSDATVLTPVYTPGASDISNGTVVLTLTANGNASCDPAVDNMTLTITTGGDAGSDSTADVCNTETTFDLLAAKGDGDNGGVWNDLDGSGAVITGNLANLSAVPAGVYNFEYVVGTAPCTPDDAILTVTVIEQLSAGTNDSTQICVETSSLDLLAAKGDGDNGGIWTDTDGSGATIAGNVADFTGVVPGFYQFTYEIGAAPCAEESATLVVEILAEPDAGSDATANACNNYDSFDLLAAKGDGDDGGLWDDTDASGATIAGNIADLTGVTPGTYNFTYILDNGLCSPDFATLTVTVGELEVTSNVLQPVSCGANGTITLNVVTGTADMIVWLDSDDNVFDDGDGNDLILSAPAGTYTVMVSDLTTTCMYQETFTITDPATFTVNAVVTDQTSCDVNDGSITLTLTPPSATATFVWSGPGIDATNENNQDQANLVPGDYTVAISDGACSFTDTYTIAPAESISAVASNATLATCGVDDGTITIDVTQVGTNPYDIIINDSDNNFVAEALNQDGFLNPLPFGGLGQGTYNIIVRDNVTNCEVNLSVLVNDNAPFAIDNASITNITTCDAAEGAINLTLSGTSGTETISWTGPDGFSASTQNISGLAEEGTYTVTIVDAGCTVTASYQITAPTDCDFDCTTFRVTPLTEAASCFGVQDGKIFFLLTNVSSTSPLKFNVKPAGAPDTDYVEYTVNNLGSGTIIEIPADFLPGQYNVIAEDETLGCASNVINVNIGTKANITDNLSVIQPTCEVATGTITVTLSGTADAFTFELYLQSDLDSLVASNNNGIFGGLDEGVYAIKYINANPNGCTLPTRENIQIEDSNAFVAMASDKEDVTCFGAQTGSVVITLQGAASGFYSIDNGSSWVEFTSGNRITGLPAINNLLVSDEPGTSSCEVSLAVDILHLSDEILLNGPVTLVTEASCTASEEVGEIRVPAVTGGVAPYTYLIDAVEVQLDDDRIIGGLSRNVSSLVILDNVGCFSQPINIGAIVSPNEVRATVTEINPANNCVSEPEGIEIVIDQNTIDNVPGPYGLIINRVDDSETTEFVLDINVSGSNTFIVGPGENLDFTFEKGVRYRWTIRSISNDQACSADNFITINGGAIIPSFTVEGRNVACFGESGSIILENIVVDPNPNYPTIIELYERDSNSSPTTFNVDELSPNGRFIISNNNTDRIERGTYEVRIVQLNTSCPTLLIASDLLTVIIDAPTRQLQAELVPEPNLPPGVDRARSEMNPMPTTRPDLADGSISVRLTTLTGATGYSARIFLVEPMGGNNTAQYSLPQQPVPFNSSQTVTFDNLLPGIYEIEYYDAFGCGLSGNRLIFGEDGTTELVVDFDRSPFVPNVFTPNNDGVNDFFEILNLPDNGAELIVTNRNGAIVYRNKSYRPSNLWDGGEQPDGIYFYQLKINETVQNGWVEILRGKGR